jgi:hypothetical protein
MKARTIFLAAVLCSAAATAALTASDVPGVPYPDGYRTWRHVKSMVIEPGSPLYGAFGGIHYLYANDVAVRGYATGSFGDGAVIVFNLYEAVGADHTISAGAQKVVGVMHKDAKKFAATGGWGFEAFAGNSRTERVVGGNAASACFACHQSQKSSDYVFSRYQP